MEREQVIGTSSTSTTGVTDEPLEQLIRKARDSLFEEELFHEMSREMRLLLPYDAETRDHTICLPASPSDPSLRQVSSSQDRKILIDLIPAGVTMAAQANTEDELANVIALSLRILLCHAHRKKLQRRSQIPPPLTDQPRPTIPSMILRPLINHFQHHDVIAAVHTFVRSTTTVLKSAGLEMSFDITTDLAIRDFPKSIVSTTTQQGSLSAVDKFLDSLTGELNSTTTISLPTHPRNNRSSEVLKIDLRTNHSPPVFGTEYTVHIPASAGIAPASESKVKKLNFTNFDGFRSYITSFLSVYLAQNILAAQGDDWIGIENSPEVVRTVNGAHKTRFWVRLDDAHLCLGFRPSSRTSGQSEFIWKGESGAKTFLQVADEFGMQ